MDKTQWLWMQASLAVIARAVSAIKHDARVAAAQTELPLAAAEGGQ